MSTLQIIHLTCTFQIQVQGFFTLCASVHSDTKFASLFGPRLLVRPGWVTCAHLSHFTPEEWSVLRHSNFLHELPQPLFTGKHSSAAQHWLIWQWQKTLKHFSTLPIEFGHKVQYWGLSRLNQMSNILKFCSFLRYTVSSTELSSGDNVFEWKRQQAVWSQGSSQRPVEFVWLQMVRPGANKIII